jgi:Na+/H+ antiporter NhaA
LSTFVRTETGSAMLLLAVTLLAIVWAAVAPSSYEAVWTTRLSVRLGNDTVGQDLRGWVNNGLMTLFFFVIGLEARRSIDIGDLRERSRVLLPLLAGVGGMVASIAIYLLLNAGSGGAHGWGIAMSTDTAFALSLSRWSMPSPCSRCGASCSRSSWSTTWSPCWSSRRCTAVT